MLTWVKFTFDNVGVEAIKISLAKTLETAVPPEKLEIADEKSLVASKIFLEPLSVIIKLAVSELVPSDNLY